MSPLKSPTLAHNQRRRRSPVPTVDGKGLRRSLPATACALSVEVVASWVVHHSYVPIPPTHGGAGAVFRGLDRAVREALVKASFNEAGDVHRACGASRGVGTAKGVRVTL